MFLKKGIKTLRRYRIRIKILPQTCWPLLSLSSRGQQLGDLEMQHSVEWLHVWIQTILQQATSAGSFSLYELASIARVSSRPIVDPLCAVRPLGFRHAVHRHSDMRLAAMPNVALVLIRLAIYWLDDHSKWHSALHSQASTHSPR